MRDRLRWPVDASYLSTVFTLRDVVEVWCTGTHVKGAWLQARVRQVCPSQDAVICVWAWWCFIGQIKELQNYCRTRIEYTHVMGV